MAFAAVAGAVAGASKTVFAHAGTAIAGGVAAAKEVYDYNRENFMEDREQRMKKEFQERKLRCKQASLWREDVRDFVSLTERKMKYYLLVNVLLLGFNVNLWCEGRLPEHTPGWLMMGNQIATGGSFLFLLLTVWLSMHAAVAAQSYQARVLTQLVRLPIPTWAELEACRTYASEFEALDPRQMFRVPFATGAQEDVAAKLAAEGANEDESTRLTEGESVAVADVAVAAAYSAAAADAAARENAPTEAELVQQQVPPEICQCGNVFAADSLFCRACGQRRAPPTVNSTTAADIAASAATAAQAIEMRANARMAADPWGLERRGDDIYELGTQHGKDVAKLKHIKIIRQAAVYWQTYDAFARVSMSVGVNQLMLAMSYYILGYVLCQVRCPAAAFAGVICLIATAEVVARIDLTLPARQQRLIQLLLVFGPAVSCVAAYNWGLEYELAERIAEGLAPIAFISHGAVLALMTLFLRVREQQNGAMLPLAFQGVLYLDVFGWIHEDTATEAAENAIAAAAEGCAPDVVEQVFERTISPGTEDISPVDPQATEGLSAAVHALSRTAAAKSKAQPGRRGWTSSENITDSLVSDIGERTPLGYYAADYVHSDDECSSTSDLESVLSMEAQTGQEGVSLQRPALAAVAFDKNGRPLPVRPDDLRAKAVAQDMSRLPGAPRMWEVVSAVDAPAKEFFEPVTFMPPEGRRRRKVDELFEDTATVHAHSRKHHHDDLNIETGHDNESPGLMPWTIFRSSATLLCLVWIFAAVIAFWEALAGRHNRSPWWIVEEGTEGETSVELLAHHVRDVPHPSLLGLWAAGFAGQSVGPKLEPIAVTWPYRTISPTGLSCDASGDRLLVTDGLSTFIAELSQNAGEPETTASGRLRASKQISPSAGLRADFHEASHCAGLRGEAAMDTALICPNATGAACTALVLHRHGRRVAVCQVHPNEVTGVMLPELADQRSTEAFQITRSWLERADADVLGDRAEEIEWILADHSCGERAEQPLHHGCASVGTSRGRVARLQQGIAADGHDQERQPLVPVDVIDEREQEKEQEQHPHKHHEPHRPGVVRAFNSRYIGVLQPQRMSVRVLDLALSGTQAGSIPLPPLGSVDWREASKADAHAGHRGGLGSSHHKSRNRDHHANRKGGVRSFCAGGKHLYLLGEGPIPTLWRYELPEGLWPSSQKEFETLGSWNSVP